MGEQLPLFAPEPQPTWRPPSGKHACGRDPNAGPGSCYYWWEGCPNAERRGCFIHWKQQTVQKAVAT